MSEEEKKEIKIRQISLKVINNDTGGELNNILHIECEFCNKSSVIQLDDFKIHEKLENNEFYCTHCLRYQYFKKKPHILLLTLRAVIGYYYYVHYNSALASHKIYYSQIKEYMNSHVQVGLANPVFLIDPETFLWFVDFTRVGKGRHKIACEDVLETIKKMIDCFDIPTHLKNAQIPEFYSRFQTAVQKFYTQRSRPIGKRIITPTLVGCGAYENHEEDVKKFILLNFIRKDG